MYNVFIWVCRRNIDDVSQSQILLIAYFCSQYLLILSQFVANSMIRLSQLSDFAMVYLFSYWYLLLFIFRKYFLGGLVSNQIYRSYHFYFLSLQIARYSKLYPKFNWLLVLFVDGSHLKKNIWMCVATGSFVIIHYIIDCWCTGILCWQFITQRACNNTTS